MKMGLGPPVCERCQVIGELSPHVVPTFWRCPICFNDEMKWSAWSCGIDAEELESNLRFLKFMKGIE